MPVAAVKAAFRRPTRHAVACLVAASSLYAAHAQAFSLDDVAARAQDLMRQPYTAPTSNLPPVFNQMQFGDYIKIQPKRDAFQWQDLDSPFKLSFYHQGMHFNTPVKINEVVGDAVQELHYQPERFDFGGLNFDQQTTSKLGYAGFRVMYPINDPNRLDEIMSILGASYFRVIGKGQVYGLSGRGLAIDTGLSRAEEFPAFREFWIERPAPGAKELVFYALLDSPRAAGAYRFVLRPGEDAQLDVQARVYMRGQVERLGIAPLTSMFMFGPNQPAAVANYRPALHDSNGLAIHTGNGEWLWRPLNNPSRVTVSAFEVTDPKGFGLLQRGRSFAQYEDLKDRYDLRPSAWIEPIGKWGKGHVELIEIPAPDETNDNMVALWRPAELPPPGEPLAFAYRMHWTMDEPGILGGKLAWVKNTMRTAGEITQSNLIRRFDGTTGMLVDFQGPTLTSLPPDAAVSAQVSVNGNGEIVEQSLVPNPPIQGYRLALRVKVKDPQQPVELRAALVDREQRALSETWSYQLPPNASHSQVRNAQ